MLKNLLWLLVFLSVGWTSTCYLGILRATEFWSANSQSSTESYWHSKLLEYTLPILRHFVFAWLFVALFTGVLTCVVTLYHLLKATVTNSDLEHSRRVIAKLLAHEFALLHLGASIIAMLVAMTLPWPYAPGFIKTNFLQCVGFMIGSAFLLGAFQSITDRPPTSNPPYLYDAFRFIGYLFLHAFVVYMTLGRLYLVDTVITSIRANIRDRHGAGWVLFITNFITGHAETYLSLYSVKICFSATAPCLASLIASVEHFIAQQRLRSPAPVETHLTTAYLREGFIFSSHHLETMFDNLPAKLIAFITTLKV